MSALCWCGDRTLALETAHDPAESSDKKRSGLGVQLTTSVSLANVGGISFLSAKARVLLKEALRMARQGQMDNWNEIPKPKSQGAKFGWGAPPEPA